VADAVEKRVADVVAGGVKAKTVEKIQHQHLARSLQHQSQQESQEIKSVTKHLPV
jgi:hypothetical protein